MSATSTAEQSGAPMFVRAVKLVTIAGAVVFGLGLVVIAVTLGHCSAFGGACSGDTPSLLDDDVFGMAAFGAALVVGVPVALTGPWRRRLPLACLVAAVAALIVGLLARSIAHG